MKLNKLFLTASLLVAGLTASAQEVVTEYVFQPHLYGQLQLGGQETLGEGKFGKLLSGNAQITLGYKFNPYIATRLAINAWHSRGGIKIDGIVDKYYKWCYVAPTVDVVLDLTNAIGGYNPNRCVEFDLIAGLGANAGFHNHMAREIQAGIVSSLNEGRSDADKKQMSADGVGLNAVWGGKWRLLGQVGCALNFNVSERVQLGLELMANVTNDTYNSKAYGQNTDWYFNALVGVGYSFGPKFNTVTRVIEPAPEPQIIEKVVEKIVEVPVQVEEKKVEKEMFRRDVFFLINRYNIRPQEMEKVAQVAEYMQTHPNAIVTITGYADKGTGTKAFNLRLSAQRSQSVAKCLQEKYFIPASRMIVKSMGEDMYQPYPDAVQNRVAICIAE